jgi:hypothetical protein
MNFFEGQEIFTPIVSGEGEVSIKRGQVAKTLNDRHPQIQLEGQEHSVTSIDPSKLFTIEDIADLHVLPAENAVDHQPVDEVLKDPTRNQELARALLRVGFAKAMDN